MPNKPGFTDDPAFFRRDESDGMKIGFLIARLQLPGRTAVFRIEQRPPLACDPPPLVCDEMNAAQICRSICLLRSPVLPAVFSRQNRTIHPDCPTTFIGGKGKPVEHFFDAVGLREPGLPSIAGGVNCAALANDPPVLFADKADRAERLRTVGNLRAPRFPSVCRPKDGSICPHGPSLF